MTHIAVVIDERVRARISGWRYEWLGWRIDAELAGDPEWERGRRDAKAARELLGAQPPDLLEGVACGATSSFYKTGRRESSPRFAQGLERGAEAFHAAAHRWQSEAS